ncbi:MAG: hypothetical protein PHP74_01050 [Candidatus Gracilibacteria bacterium]|nr:hypothetical protein [Candidatus Gracilibacteria bacterium]
MERPNEGVIDAKEIATKLVDRYKFPSVMEDLEADAVHEDRSDEEVRSLLVDRVYEGLNEAIELFKSAGVSEDAIVGAFDKFYAQYPEGTDLDQEFEVAHSGIVGYLESELLEERMGALEKNVGSAFNRLLDEFGWDDNMENERLKFLAAFLPLLEDKQLDKALFAEVLSFMLDEFNEEYHLYVFNDAGELKTMVERFMEAYQKGGADAFETLKEAYIAGESNYFKVGEKGSKAVNDLCDYVKGQALQFDKK